MYNIKSKTDGRKLPKIILVGYIIDVIFKAEFNDKKDYNYNRYHPYNCSNYYR